MAIKTFSLSLSLSLSKSSVLLAFGEQNPPVTGGFPSQRASNRDSVAIPDSKVHGANIGPTWDLLAPDGPHVGPMNPAIRDAMKSSSYLHISPIYIETLKVPSYWPFGSRIHRSPVDSPHKGPVIRTVLPCPDVFILPAHFTHSDGVDGGEHRTSVHRSILLQRLCALRHRRICTLGSNHTP